MTEAQHQANVFRWTKQPKIRSKWPELALLFHVKNETAEGAGRVAADRIQGVKKGVPDLCLPVARGPYHGLWIEMKNERGRVSDAQQWWVSRLTEQNYMAAVCHGWEAAVKLLEWYLEGAAE